MRRIVLASLLILSLASAAGAADTPDDTPQNPLPGLFGPRLRDALESLSRSMVEVFRALPRYDAPQMLDNGDIVIRRMPPTRPETIDPSGTRPGANRPIAV